MLYSGDLTDVCAISFTPVCEIEQPVGFESGHAYECECIVEWLTTQRSSNPMTGECIEPGTAVATVLHPLIIRGDEHVPCTQAALDRAGVTVGGADVVSWKAKFGWDAVFFAALTLGNRWIGGLAVNVCLLFCCTLMMCAHYRAVGPWIALTCLVSYVATVVIGRLCHIYSPDASALEFFQLLNVELFSTKVSIDVVTFAIWANFC